MCHADNRIKCFLNSPPLNAVVLFCVPLLRNWLEPVATVGLKLI